MVISAGTLAGRITWLAVVHTLCGCSGALIVWNRLGVLRGVWLLAVAADAGVYEGALSSWSA